MADVAESAAPEVQRWLRVIAAYDREFKRWEERAAKIVKIYRDHDSQADTRNGTTQFNILWSNVQTCVPAVFARLPKPDVSRRFRDNDPIGRVAALIIERALEFEIEHYPDYKAAMENAVLDRFLGGRGIAWVRYEPHFRAVQLGEPTDGDQLTEDVDEQGEELDYECTPVDYVHYRDFGHTVARTWEEVSAVWRKVYLGRDALIERFGEDIGSRIPLDTKPEDQKGNTEADYQACIYEIWDKTTNKAIWLSKSLGEILDERDDPLELENFWPCPRPLFATLTTDGLVPVPDYKLYQDQAKELNTLADRIDGLIKALQVKGVHDSSIPELARLFKEAGNGDLIPVKNWGSFAEKAGLKGAIDIVDIKPIAEALNQAYTAMDQVKAQIYEVMGIADILRGSSDPNETLGAQKLKGQFGSLRLRRMQSKVVEFATEILQIKAQIICKHYQPDTLMQIGAVEQLSQADQMLVPQALQLIKQGPLRAFRIEVSSDSMVEMDEQQEKMDRLEFLKASSSFLQQAIPAMQGSPEITPLIVEMLKFGISAFKVGKTIQGQFDQFAEQAKQMAANPQKKPDPEVTKAQTQMQVEQMKAQTQLQLAQNKAQVELSMDRERAQLDAQVEQSRQASQAQQNQHQNMLEQQRAEMQAQMEAALEQQRQQSQLVIEQMKLDFQHWKAELDAAVKIESANISSKAKMENAATQTSTAEVAREVK